MVIENPDLKDKYDEIHNELLKYLLNNTTPEKEKELLKIIFN